MCSGWLYDNDSQKKNSSCEWTRDEVRRNEADSDRGKKQLVTHIFRTTRMNERERT